MQITRMLVPQAKWNLKCPYDMIAEFITVHNTGNNASAMAEVSYMIGNNSATSFHVAVDDYRIVQGIDFSRNAFHAGDGRNGPGNRKSISIEICYSKSGGERFIKAERLATQYIAYILKERNWGIDRVRKHQDWSGKYCPHRTLDLGWTRFLNMIQAELNELNRESLKLEYIYNPDIYISKYGDLQKMNPEQLYNHLIRFGIKEGRVFSYVFDAKFYANKYADLKKAYGNDYMALFNHYITWGFWEGRQASAIYDPKYYLENNGDLKAAFGNNYRQALNHFFRFGMKEGRIASADFNVKAYKNRYKDLNDNFKNDMQAYFRHYIIFGADEKRICK